MKRILVLSATLVFSTYTAKAQLVIDYLDQVAIANTGQCYYPLTVGPLPYGATTYNIAAASSVVHDPSKINVGVEGFTSANTLVGQYFGVRGVVYPYTNTANGCFYGLTGIYSGLGMSSGTGILGTVGYSTYAYAPNIQGKYAGYFLGDAYVSSSLSTSQVYTTSDMRLKEDVVAFSDVESGQATLDKIMLLKVYEYNLKDRGELDIDKETQSKVQGEVPELLDEITRRKTAFEAQRHYGVAAQELQSVYPNLVRKAKDGYLSVNYLEMIPILIRGIQELSRSIDDVKGKQGKVARDGNMLAQDR